MTANRCDVTCPKCGLYFTSEDGEDCPRCERGKDAERLDWLEANNASIEVDGVLNTWDAKGGRWLVLPRHPEITPRKGVGLREAIDSARSFNQLPQTPKRESE
jgi:hypothetical protein